MGDSRDQIEGLKGCTLSAVKNHGGEELIFTLDSGERYRLGHTQECCEDVRIEDIIGDLNDLVGSPILMAEEATNCKRPENVSPEFENPVSCTWTFYKLATIKGYVTVRWYGESNGYYSESVEWERLDG